MQNVSGVWQEHLTQRNYEGVPPVADPCLPKVRAELVRLHRRQPSGAVHHFERDPVVGLLRIPYPAGDAITTGLVDIALKRVQGRG